jgi:hypothetical protein
MHTEIQYKTFDELLDSVRGDFKTFDLEGLIGTQELIKVAQRVNADLGLRVSMAKSKVLDVKNGKAKLPSDLHVLNFAMICHGKNVTKPTEHLRTYSDGLLEGVLKSKLFTVNHYVTTMNIVPGDNIVTHDLNTENFLVQAFAPDGTMLNFEIRIDGPNVLSIINTGPVTVFSVKIVVFGAAVNTGEFTSTVTDIANLCESPENPYVIRWHDNLLTKYEQFIPMEITKAKSLSVETFNIVSRNFHKGYLKNGFLVAGFDEGTIYMNYQSTMEDDEGNLVVMDHPTVNEYYEYALKQRILENLLMAGEEVTNKLNLIEVRFRAARNNALSYVNTPDFNELKRIVQANRKAMYHKYYKMFES